MKKKAPVKKKVKRRTAPAAPVKNTVDLVEQRMNLAIARVERLIRFWRWLGIGATYAVTGILAFVGLASTIHGVFWWAEAWPIAYFCSFIVVTLLLVAAAIIYEIWSETSIYEFWEASKK